MFRKPSGGMGFSFTRFANNAMPSMMFDSVKDPGHISLPQKDMFYGHQIVSPSNPYALDELSLWQSGILDSESISKKAYKKLQKCGVLDAEGHVDTMRIGPNFTHDLAVVSVVRQKQIIDLLFWWEEECHRLRKLEGEKKELDALVRSAKDDVEQHDGDHEKKCHLDQLMLLLERVRLKIRQRPSERMSDLEQDQDDIMVRFRTGSVNDSSRPRETSSGLPPQYNA